LKFPQHNPLPRWREELLTNESIIEKTHSSENLPLPTGRQALPSLPSGPGSAPASGSESPPARREGLMPRREALWAGGQRGGIPSGARVPMPGLK